MVRVGTDSRSAPRSPRRILLSGNPIDSSRSQRSGSRSRWSRFSGAELVQIRATRSAVIAVRKRSEEHTSELQSLMRISYAVFCLKKKKNIHHTDHPQITNITLIYILPFILLIYRQNSRLNNNTLI